MKNNNLKRARLDLDLTQAEVAGRVGINVVSYQRYEYGERLPDIKTAFCIAEVLHKDVTALWNGTSMRKYDFQHRS